ncbi:unnamed protein product, partial [Vitrella brassicaformis CCMP3155]
YSPPPNNRVDEDTVDAPHFGQVADQLQQPMEPQPQQKGQGVQQQQHQQLHQQEADVVVGPLSHPAAAIGQSDNGEASPAGVVAQPQLQPTPSFAPPSIPNSAHFLPPPPPIAVAVETPQFPLSEAQQGAADGGDVEGQGRVRVCWRLRLWSCLSVTR